MLLLLLRDAYACIANEYAHVSIVENTIAYDHLSLTRELQSIGEEMAQDLRQHTLVVDEHQTIIIAPAFHLNLFIGICTTTVGSQTAYEFN